MGASAVVPVVVDVLFDELLVFLMHEFLLRVVLFVHTTKRVGGVMMMMMMMMLFFFVLLGSKVTI